MNGQHALRISHIMLSKGLGGAEGYFIALCESLCEDGHSVQAICQPGFRGLARLRRIPGLQIDLVRLRIRHDPFARRRLRKVLAEFNPVVVHTHLARASQLGATAAASLSIPVMCKLHNYVKLKYYRYVDCFNATTRAQRDYLLDQGMDATAVVQIPNFSRQPAVDAARAPRPDAPLIASYGRMVHKKGFDLLIQAFAALRQAHPGARLVIGGDGPEKSSLHTLAETLGVQQAVQFPGWIEDTAGFLDQADLFVLPSRDEPFGIVVLEAMARGLPLVATRSHGPREILDDTQAWLCETDQAAELDRAISAALAAPDQARQRATRALENYRQRYHHQAVVPQILDCYRRLTENTP